MEYLCLGLVATLSFVISRLVWAIVFSTVVREEEVEAQDENASYREPGLRTKTRLKFLCRRWGEIPWIVKRRVITVQVLLVPLILASAAWPGRRSLEDDVDRPPVVTPAATVDIPQVATSVEDWTVTSVRIGRNFIRFRTVGSPLDIGVGPVTMSRWVVENDSCPCTDSGSKEIQEFYRTSLLLRSNQNDQMILANYLEGLYLDPEWVWADCPRVCLRVYALRVLEDLWPIQDCVVEAVVRISQLDFNHSDISSWRISQASFEYLSGCARGTLNAWHEQHPDEFQNMIMMQ